jgi:dTDP-4-dehydrorhamnose reductase
MGGKAVRMKILLFGAAGQVGWELQRSLSTLGQVHACDRTKVDLTNLAKIRAVIQDYQPAIIVNAAAYTAVDKAESEPELARRINAEAVGVMAEEAKHLNAWFVHYSTDYVFDGTNSKAYTETDVPNPLSVYGKTKLQGEEAIRRSGCQHLIFRTSWVYAAHGRNFAKTILRLAKERTELRVVADQFGAPTSAEYIADITALALYQIKKYSPQYQREDTGQERNLLAPVHIMGTYHLVPKGETSWHGFARYVIEQAHQHGYPLCASMDKVFPISTAEYPLPAARPANSCLATQKLVETFGIHLPPWQYHVDRVVSELIKQEVM